jgi:hypothetical protein
VWQFQRTNQNQIHYYLAREEGGVVVMSVHTSGLLSFSVLRNRIVNFFKNIKKEKADI